MSDIDKIIALVDQLAPEEKQHLRKYLGLKPAKKARLEGSKHAAEITAKLIEMGVIEIDEDRELAPAISDDEAWALGDRLGAAGLTLSDIVIQERREGMGQ